MRAGHDDRARRRAAMASGSGLAVLGEQERTDEGQLEAWKRFRGLLGAMAGRRGELGVDVFAAVNGGRGGAARALAGGVLALL
jgi:hypothetical protein